MKENVLKLNIVLSLLKTLMSLIFPLITFPYASRVLLPEGLGKVNFAQSIVSYFSLIATLGIPIYSVREIAKRKNNSESVNKFFSEIFFINVVSTLLAYLLLFVIVNASKKLSSYSTLIYIMSSVILFSTIGIDWLYTGLEDFLYITVRSFIFQCFSLILLFLFVKDKDDTLMYAGISVIASAGSNICNFIHSRKYVKFVSIKVKSTIVHLKTIIIIFITSVANSIYTMLDTTMIGVMTSDVHIGFYAAATKVNRIVLSVIITIGSVMLPRLSYVKSMNDERGYRALLNRSISMMLMVACPCVVGLELLCKPLVLFLSGDQYLPALTAMRIMNPIIFIVCFGNFFGVQVFLPNNKECLNFVLIVFAAIINFILNCILIPKYSEVGAAVASIIAESFVSVSSIILGYKYIELKFVIINCFKYIVNSILMGVVVYFISKMFSSNTLILLVSTITGIVVYGLLLFLEKDPIVMSVLKIRKKK